MGACIFLLAIASYLYATTLSKGIKVALISINQEVQIGAKQSIILRRFTEFIEVHSSTQQLRAEQLNICLVQISLKLSKIYPFQIDQQFFRFISTFHYDGIYLESDLDLRSNANDSDTISSA